jgi:hypothetical protein
VTRNDDVEECDRLRMIRKLLYISEGHRQSSVGWQAPWRCTEAEVVRAAIDRLPDPVGDPIQQLQAAGVLLPRHDDGSLPEEADLEALERELEDFLAGQTDVLPLSEAVLDDRR